MKIRILVPLLLIALGATAQGKKTVFSAMETNHIRVATPGLFSQRELIELPLEDIPDTEYSFPLPGGKVISPYGRGRGRHSGIDIKTCAKDTIRSAFNGVVRMSKPYSAYGNVVVVRHDFGLETIYSHNFKNLVHCGDTVKAGQPIALTGRTGRASTEHLHFETRVNGQHFDPNIIFNMKEQTLNRQRIGCSKKETASSCNNYRQSTRSHCKKYPMELFKYPNVSLHLQNVSLKERIELKTYQ